MNFGNVIETIELKDKIWINVEDDTKPKWDDKNFSQKQMSVFVEKSHAARCVQNCDQITFESDSADILWTPRKKSFTDYRLKKIGKIGAKRPTELTT